MTFVDRWPSSWPFSPGERPATAGSAMVATTDRYATEVGLQVLEDGGNAADAAVAISFALAVVNPEAGNVGGGGFLLYRTSSRTTHALDYRSSAPAAATTHMFESNRGRPDDPSVLGHLAAAVPGSVRGLWDAHRELGRLPWARLVDPAVELARGFTVRARFIRSFEPHIVEGLSQFEETKEIFLPDDRIPELGSTFRQPDLAETLERIRDLGAEGFYGGETARRIVAEMERQGGLISATDLSSYRSRWRSPLVGTFRDFTVLSMPPSSSGGVTLQNALNVFSALPAPSSGWHSPERIHLEVEAWKLAYADRNHSLADPDFAAIPLDLLLSQEYALERARTVSAERATPSQDVKPGRMGPDDLDPSLVPPHESDSTTHFSVVDLEGNAASVTTTLNTWYGSKVVVPGTGVLLNNEMDDFTAAPGVPNFFGLVQGTANRVAPGKRSLSAMTPTILTGPDGDTRLVVGTPGGATIITTVFQVICNIVDHGMDIAQAVAAPRVHHQHLPDTIAIEPGGLADHVHERLEEFGHSVTVGHELSGDTQAIWRTRKGTLEGSADPRRGGVVLGY